MSQINRNVAHCLETKRRTNDIEISERLDFSSLFLSEVLLDGLKSSGFIRPSPIQLKAIPLGRCGLDLIVQAKSGTGKTCVFTVIALDGLNLDSTKPQVLVLAPTREIALQIYEVFQALGSSMAALRCQTFIGGMPLHEDKQKIKNCHVVIGTPGRVKQLIERGELKSDSIRLFVLDEADKLLEENFQKQVNWIYSALPENKQILALSATYPEYLAQHLTAYMRDPTFVRLNSHDPALLGIKQYYLSVNHHPLPNKVFDTKSTALIRILSSVQFQQCLVFSNFQTRAEDLSNLLNSRGWPAAHIAGSYDQRARNEAMHKLRSFKCRILISTDLTSRGIDCDNVNLVINLDLPQDHETYLHRIGRAGRFGSFGAAISLVCEGKELNDLRTVEKRCNTNIKPLPDPIPSNLTDCTDPIYLDDLVSSEKIITRQQQHELNGICDVIESCHSNGFTCDAGVSLGNDSVRTIVGVDVNDGYSVKNECDDSRPNDVDIEYNSRSADENISNECSLNLSNSAVFDGDVQECTGSFSLDKMESESLGKRMSKHSTPSQQLEDVRRFSTPQEGAEPVELSKNLDCFLDETANVSDADDVKNDESSVVGEMKYTSRTRSDSETSDVTDYGVWLDDDIPLQIPNLILVETKYTDYAENRNEVERLLQMGPTDDVSDDDDAEDDVIDFAVAQCSNQLLKSISNYVVELEMSRLAEMQIGDNLFDDNRTFIENELIVSNRDKPDVLDNVAVDVVPSSEEVDSGTSADRKAEHYEPIKTVAEDGIRIRKPRNFDQRSTAAFLAAIREKALKDKPDEETRTEKPEVPFAMADNVTTEGRAYAATVIGDSEHVVSEKQRTEPVTRRKTLSSEKSNSEPRGRMESREKAEKPSLGDRRARDDSITEKSNHIRLPSVKKSKNIVFSDDLCYRRDYLNKEEKWDLDESDTESDYSDTTDDTHSDALVSSQSEKRAVRNDNNTYSDNSSDYYIDGNNLKLDEDEVQENDCGNDYADYYNNGYGCASFYPEYFQNSRESSGAQYYGMTCRRCGRRSDTTQFRESVRGNGQWPVHDGQFESVSEEHVNHDETDYTGHAYSAYWRQAGLYHSEAAAMQNEFFESYFHWYYAYVESVNYWRNYRRWYRQCEIRRRNDVMNRAMARAQQQTFRSDFQKKAR